MKEDKSPKKKLAVPAGGMDAKSNKATKERAKSRSKSAGDGQGEDRKFEPSKAERLAVARLQTHYQDKIAPELMKRFAFSSPMQVPRITKISLNMGVGEAVGDKKVLDAAVADMTKIAGQKPVTTKAKKAIATYKTRKGYPIGCMVTLRRRRMYEFLDRLVSIAIPRTRDFRGISGKGFDGRGNYSMGIKEQIIFPEIDYDKVDTLRGMNISITTTAKNDEEARALLDGFNFPFKK